MRDRNARVENAGAYSMESCLQKRVSMLSYRRANVLRVFSRTELHCIKKILIDFLYSIANSMTKL